MPHPRLLPAWLLGLALLAATAPAAEDAVVAHDGSFAIGGVSFAVRRLGPDGKPDLAQDEHLRTTGGTRGSTAEGVLGERHPFRQDLRQTADGAWRCQVEVGEVAAADADAWALEAWMPGSQFDGTALAVDDRSSPLAGGATVGATVPVHRLAFPSTRGRLLVEGSFPCQVRGDRVVRGQRGHLVRILLAAPEAGPGRLSADLRLRLEPWRLSSVPLTAQANRTYDGAGADLRGFPGGRLDVHGAWFAAATGDGPACLAVSGNARGGAWAPMIRVPVAKAKAEADTAPADALYLLHAGAWLPALTDTAGSIEVEYADGERQRIALAAHRDLADAMDPRSRPNAVLAWQGGGTALFASRFALRGKPVAALAFAGNGGAAWVVAGLALGDAIPMRVLEAHEIRAGGAWTRIEHRVDSEPGGVLDLSFLNDGPAGRHGRVVARDGYLEFAGRPGEAVRFYGANVCMTANYQDRERTDALADQLARMGYNTIRLHHFDELLGDRAAPVSTVFAPDALDRLDYLFAALKRRGMYVVFDLYNLRLPRAGELAGWSDPKQTLYDYIRTYKMLAAIDPAAEDNWKTFVRNLLTHRNPHTGERWMDDPALLSLCIWNEANIYAFWKAQEQRYLERFATWLAARGEDAAGARPEHRLFERFLYELQADMYRRGRAFLDELGVVSLIADLNMHPHIALNLIRDRMDLVENHVYWDHPSYFTRDHQPPLGFVNRSALFSAASVPRQIMETRILGKPFSVSEYHFAGPNHCRAEAGPLMGAYAALQGWNIVHRFAYAHYGRFASEPMPLRHFDIATDPMSLLSDRIAVLLFRRGDVREATTTIPFAMSEAWLERPGLFAWGSGRVPDPYTRLGLVAKVGSVNLSGGRVLPAGYPAAVALETFPAAQTGGRPFLAPDGALAGELTRRGILAEGLADDRRERYRSETGELSLDAKRGGFAAVTARSEYLVANASGPATGAALRIEAASPGFSVIGASALAAGDLRSSRRLVLFHLTDVQNTGLRYRDATDTILDNWGDLPHLVRIASATVAIARSAPERDRVWAVDLAGRRLAPVATRVRGGDLVIPVSTAAGVCAYEVAADP